VNSPQWDNMLFVITFDEHGGTWDHVSPTATISPDDHEGTSGFKFDRLGVRVPTILISPYAPKGMVFRAPDGSTYDFDHTSFPATFSKWAGIDPKSANLGARVASAPTFEGVLSATARTDTPTFSVPSDFATQGGGVGKLHVGVSTSFERKPTNIRDFREVCDASTSIEDFRERMEELGED
jgi:phospholipase C